MNPYQQPCKFPRPDPIRSRRQLPFESIHSEESVLQKVPIKQHAPRPRCCLLNRSRANWKQFKEIYESIRCGRRSFRILENETGPRFNRLFYITLRKGLNYGVHCNVWGRNSNSRHFWEKSPTPTLNDFLCSFKKWKCHFYFPCT